MKTLTLGLVMSSLLVGACAIPGMFAGGGKSTARESSHSRTTTTEEINGQPIEPGELELEEDGPKKKKSSKKKVAADDFGATCKTNKDCSSNTCFVGSGELGYCTMMCNSWSECPSHWECQKAGNAPQRICQQDSW